MAREPYRTRMINALSSGTKEQQERKQLLFTVEQAGSMGSDVAAALEAERIEREVHRS